MVCIYEGLRTVLDRADKYLVFILFLFSKPLVSCHCLCLCVIPGWHEDMDRKMSLTSLGQDQAKFGSRNALNRRVTTSVLVFLYRVISHKVFCWRHSPHPSSLT